MSAAPPARRLGAGLPRFNPGLRARLLMLVLLGVVLPLGILGLWVSTSARRTGVELVHVRARESLSQTVAEFQGEWVRRRSLLLDLSESAAVVGALDGTAPWTGEMASPARAELAELWQELSTFVVFLEIRDMKGERVGRLPDALGGEPFLTPPLGTLERTLPVLARFSGEELGSMAARLRLEGLLPPEFLAQGVGGSIPGIFDAETGVPLTATSIEPTLFSRDRFTWRGEEWVTAERISQEPRLRFVLASPLEPVTAPFDRASRRGGLAILLAVALSFALVSLFSRRLMRPLDRLAAAAGTVEGGDLSARVEESGPPEVRDTARAFNAMSAALDQTLKDLARKESMAAVGEFAADLAHEVRNPLTAIRTDLQRAQRKRDAEPEAAAMLVERAIASVDRLNATVSDFLRVARSGTVSLGPCDLRGPLGDAIRGSQPQRGAKGCPMARDEPPDPVRVAGDPDALQGMFLNLLLNAVDAVEEGTPVGVRLFRDRGRAVVEVWDRGPGVPDEVRDTLFDPFVTTKPGGTGLGLAIARRVAHAHGSELELERRPGETVFRVRLKLLDA
ncbi:MAG TPA: HAMP domain-containing sensor histidine kinase [Longimicrobiales bacterium]|nr:HAMP domain-containing sensor histidine kinase [Longimicrobiales bacterium]